MRSVDDKRPVWLLLIPAIVVVATALFSVNQGQDRTIQTDPPAPRFVSTEGRVEWTGAVCLNLDRWTGTTWEGIGSAELRDAKRGVWGRRSYGVTFCDMASADDDVVLLPSGAAPGLYRLCSFNGGDCVDFEYEPGG
ncbi:MAG: hypothetical protein GY926_09255 [bacterium]|nr:hypothetical protein [bacterium]